MSKPILGYTKEGKPIHPIGEGMIATAAVVSCSKCKAMIRGMGGPMQGATCMDCTPEEIKGKQLTNGQQEYKKFVAEQPDLAMYGGDPTCDHEEVPQVRGGVKCKFCSAWFCF